MKTIENKNEHLLARALAARFLDGQTEAAEEKWLYDFYAAHSAGSLPSDLENMRAMFNWYAELPKMATPQPAKSKSLRHWLAICFGVAALFTFAAIVAWCVMGYIDKTNDLNHVHASYAGSYIIRNGEKISDFNEIYDDIIESESIVDSIEAESTFYKNTLNSISDPEVRSMIENEIFLNSYE